MSGCCVIACPISFSPLTRLKTPAGIPASCTHSANNNADNGVSSLGFKITVHPAANAGKTVSVIQTIGQFHEVSIPQTPIGSYRKISSLNENSFNKLIAFSKSI